MIRDTHRTTVVPGPAPTFTGILPNVGPTSGGTPFQVNGSNFEVGAIITIDGLLATSIVRVSANELTGVTPADTLGTKDVIVQNPDGPNTGSAGDAAFTYTATPGDSFVSQLSVDVTAGGAFNITALQAANNYAFKLTGTPGAGTTINFPAPASDAAFYSRVINNTSTKDATITTGVGASIDLAAGGTIIADFDPVLGVIEAVNQIT